jgi:DNA repair exonuclease SbcCD ATPase subunit
MANQKKEDRQQLADQAAAAAEAIQEQADAKLDAAEEAFELADAAEEEAEERIKVLHADLAEVKRKQSEVEREIGREFVLLMQQDREFAELKRRTAEFQKLIEKEEILHDKARAKEAEAAHWEDAYNSAEELVRHFSGGTADKFRELLVLAGKPAGSHPAHVLGSSEFHLPEMIREPEESHEWEDKPRGEIAHLAREVKELIGSVKALTKQVGGQGAQIGSLQNSVTDLNDQIKSQHDALGEITAHLEDQETTIKTLGSDVTDLTGQVNALLAEDRAGLQEFQKLRQQNIDIQMRRAHPKWVPVPGPAQPPPPPRVYATHGTVEDAGGGVTVIAYDRADKKELDRTITSADSTYRFDRLPVRDVIISVEGRGSKIDVAEELPIQTAAVAGR